MEYLTNLSGDDWRTISIVAQGILMVLLVAVGAYQIMTIRAENKKNRTIAICDRLSSDPVLHDCLEQLHQARMSGAPARDSFKYRIKVIGLLNFLDAIAVGIHQGVYSEAMARKFHEHPLRILVGRYLKNGRGRHFDLPPGGYKYLLALVDKWDSAPDAIPIPDHHFSLTLEAEAAR